MPIVNPQVGAGNCDAHEKNDDSFFDDTEVYVDMLSNIASSGFTGGFVFTNVTVPQGAHIVTAYLTLYVYEEARDDAYVDIYGEDEDTVNNFDDEADIVNRTKTAASVPWQQDGLGIGWENSPEIKTVIQEIVDRGGWASGQDMCIIVKGGTTTKAFRCRSYDFDDNSWGAYLYIEHVVLYELSASDGLVFGDTPLLEQTVHNLSSTDGLVLGDTPATQCSFGVVATDGLVLGDTPAINLVFNIVVTDGIVFGEVLGITIRGRPAQGFILELRDASGDLVAVLENAYDIVYEQGTNQAPTLFFSIPTDDTKADDITSAHEIWLRSYPDGTLIQKFRLNKREDTRT